SLKSGAVSVTLRAAPCAALAGWSYALINGIGPVGHLHQGHFDHVHDVVAVRHGIGKVARIGQFDQQTFDLVRFLTLATHTRRIDSGSLGHDALRPSSGAGPALR